MTGSSEDEHETPASVASRHVQEGELRCTRRTFGKFTESEFEDRDTDKLKPDLRRSRL